MNVAGSAGPGNGEATADVEAMASGEVPPAAAPAPKVPRLDPVRESEARTLIREIIGRNVHIWPDGDTIRVKPTAGGGAIPSGDEADQLRRLKPEVLAVLREKKLGPPRVGRSQPEATPAIVDDQAEGKPARSGPKAAPVPRPTRTDVLARLGRLDPSTTNPEVLATARQLAAALGPHRDEGATEAQFLKWCGQARKGLDSMSVAVLIDAFEGACGKSPERRGAVFNHLVNQRSRERPRPEAR